MTLLITGGAGYVGSHAAHAAIDAGREVVVLDDLSTGFRDAVPSGAVFVRGCISDPALVRRTVKEHRVTALLHFAAKTVVSDSVADPLGYHLTNTAGSLALLHAAAAAGVRRVVFSSTAAVYGECGERRVDEDAPPRPASPYAASKRAVEQALADAAASGRLAYAALRYFNVAGADPEGRTGQSTSRATHLIKAACEAALGRRPRLEIYGTDWPTPDGTGVRDYVHVSDLARAHLRALEWLEAGGRSIVLNCGTGRGYSVREIIEAVEAAVGRPLPVSERPRRPGDLARVVADPTRAHTLLGWRAAHGLDEMVAHALAWERAQGGDRAARATPTEPAVDRRP